MSEFIRAVRELVTAPGVSREEAQEAATGLLRMADPALAAGRLRDSLTGEVGPNPYEEADRQQGYPEEGR